MNRTGFSGYAANVGPAKETVAAHAAATMAQCLIRMFNLPLAVLYYYHRFIIITN